MNGYNPWQVKKKHVWAVFNYWKYFSRKSTLYGNIHFIRNLGWTIPVKSFSVRWPVIFSGQLTGLYYIFLSSCSWKDLLPDTIRILSEKDMVVFSELDYPGHEFKTTFITTLCLMDWCPEKTTQLAAMFRWVTTYASIDVWNGEVSITLYLIQLNLKNANKLD